MAIQRYLQPMIIDQVANLPTTAQDGDQAYCQDLKLSFSYNATAALWTPSSKVVSKISTVVVNGMTTGATPIYTLEASGSWNFYPVLTIARISTVTGTGTIPIITLGTNATSYNNIVSSSLLTGLLSSMSVGTGAPSNASFSPALAGGTAIYANVTTAGLLYTTYKVTYEILGTYN